MVSFRALGAAAVLACLVVSGCESVPEVPKRTPPEPVPTTSVYQCDDAGTLTVVDSGGSVKVTTPSGREIDLPASPPESRSRYGEPPYALIVEGGDALWMKAGKRPLECKR
jgi:hypothetical protein